MRRPVAACFHRALRGLRGEILQPLIKGKRESPWSCRGIYTWREQEYAMRGWGACSTAQIAYVQPGREDTREEAPQSSSELGFISWSGCQAALEPG